MKSELWDCKKAECLEKKWLSEAGPAVLVNEDRVEGVVIGMILVWLRSTECAVLRIMK